MKLIGTSCISVQYIKLPVQIPSTVTQIHDNIINGPLRWVRHIRLDDAKPTKNCPVIILKVEIKTNMVEQ
jgi:hypothetical protein